MQSRILILTFSLAVLLVACKEDSSNTNEPNKGNPQQKLTLPEQQQLIYDLEQKLRKDSKGVFDQTQALTILNLYANYIKNNPNDTVFTPEYLFKLAQIQITLKQGKNGIENIDKLIIRYPKNKYTPNAYFLKAFTYDNVLKDSDKAVENYKIFIDKFPNHDLAASAKASLNVAGKSEEDLLKMIHSKQE